MTEDSGSIPISVMIGIPSAPIGDFENTLVGTVPQTVRSGNGPYTGPCPHGALHTVFTTTQLRALNNTLGFLTITEIRIRGFANI